MSRHRPRKRIRSYVPGEQAATVQQLRPGDVLTPLPQDVIAVWEGAYRGPTHTPKLLTIRSDEGIVAAAECLTFEGEDFVTLTLQHGSDHEIITLPAAGDVAVIPGPHHDAAEPLPHSPAAERVIAAVGDTLGARLAAAESPRTAPSLLHDLAVTSPMGDLLPALAGNPSLEMRTLEMLISHSDVSVVRGEPGHNYQQAARGIDV